MTGNVGTVPDVRAWRLRTFRLPLPLGGMIGGIVIAALVLVAILAPLIAPYNPDALDMLNSMQPASAQHILGTDNFGRDLLSRLIFGTRLSLLGPLMVVGISSGIGVPLGLLGGYVGGFIDGLLGRIWDLLLGFPPLLLAIAMIAVFEPGFVTAVIALSIIYVPLVARLVRSVVIVEKNKAYVDACRVLGYGSTRIVALHILPSILPTVAAQTTLNFGYALLDLAGLAFIGVGVQPPTADWGVMVSDGRKIMLLSPNEVIVSCVAIAVAVVAFNLLGDAMSRRFGTEQ